MDTAMEFIVKNPTILISVIVLIIFLGIVVGLIIRKRIRASEDLKGQDNFEAGHEFENYCSELLMKNGFQEVELNSFSRDFGVDVFAEKDGVSFAFQCKYYNKPIGTKAVQEIYAGKDFYHCMVGCVLTNQEFTSGAKKMSEALNILLWGKEELEAMERRAGIHRGKSL